MCNIFIKKYITYCYIGIDRNLYKKKTKTLQPHKWMLHHLTSRWRHRTVNVPVLRVEEVAACWCSSGACGWEEWGCLHLWPRSVDEKEITERQKGWGCTTVTSFTGRLLTLLSMEWTFLCGINRVHANVAGQWLYNNQTIHWYFCFTQRRCTHLQWYGAWTGEQPPRLCSF